MTQLPITLDPAHHHARSRARERIGRSILGISYIQKFPLHLLGHGWRNWKFWSEDGVCMDYCKFIKAGWN